MPSLEKSIVAAKKRSFEGVVDAGEERAGYALVPIMSMAEELIVVDIFKKFGKRCLVFWYDMAVKDNG